MRPASPGRTRTRRRATRYSYKARVIGNNTFPTEGEFCDPVKVEVLPDIDFRFRLTTADSVQFDVVKAAGANSATKATFWRGVGDAIGDIVNNRTTGEQVNYSTGYVLVDIQPTATQSNKPGPAGRVIYADAQGNLRVLWNGETKADDLWDRLKAATTTPAMGGRPFMPPYGPVRRPGMP